MKIQSAYHKHRYRYNRSTRITHCMTCGATADQVKIIVRRPSMKLTLEQLKERMIKEGY